MRFVTVSRLTDAPWQDPRDFIQLVCVHPSISSPMNDTTHARHDSISIPLLSIAGQRLVLNLRGLQSRPWTSSYVSWVVDRELAAMCHTVGESTEAGTQTTDLVEMPARAAQRATLNEASAVEREVRGVGVWRRSERTDGPGVGWDADSVDG